MNGLRLSLYSGDCSIGGGSSIFEGLFDLNSVNGESEQLRSRPSTPNPTMHSHERVLVPSLLGGNDEDPSRPQVGNSTDESSHSVCGQPCLDLIDKVDNTEDSIGNGEEMARYKTADSGNHVIEQDPANTNTQPALQHERNGLEIKHGFDKDDDYETKSVGVGSSYYDPVKRRKKEDQMKKIIECAKAGMTRDATAKKIEVSESTMKRLLKYHKVQWKQIRKGGEQSASSVNNTNPAGHDYHPPESWHGEPVCSAINSSIPDEKVGKEDDMNDNDELAMKHLNTCVVKADWSKQHMVRFNFSYTGTPSLLELEKLVASNLKAITLEPGRFKLKYRDNSDNNKHWITMFDDSHLVDALSLAENPNILILKVVRFFPSQSG